MKAIVCPRYGSTDVLELREVERPTPQDHEVRIRVAAASINAWDWDIVRGRPYAFRLIHGLARPKWPILGADVAGVVESIGSKVQRFKPGDEVFGDLSESDWGALAEYVCANEAALVKKPASMTFEQAAATPQAGLLALQSIQRFQPIEAGQRLLINGAGGGAGTFAIQLAKAAGAEVIAVDSRPKFEMMDALGADALLDYREADYTQNAASYDFILDFVAHRSVFSYARALKPNGQFIMVGGSVGALLQAGLLGSLVARKDRRISILPYKIDTGDLETMIHYFEAGTVKPVIDRIFPLEEAAAAVKHLGDGHVLGKVVVTVQVTA